MIFGNKLNQFRAKLQNYELIKELPFTCQFVPALMYQACSVVFKQIHLDELSASIAATPELLDPNVEWFHFLDFPLFPDCGRRLRAKTNLHRMHVWVTRIRRWQPFPIAVPAGKVSRRIFDANLSVAAKAHGLLVPLLWAFVPVDSHVSAKFAAGSFTEREAVHCYTVSHRNFA